MAKRSDKAKWIWIASDTHVEDCWVRARREFTLRGDPAEARLRVAAFGDYVLYVNGRYVGCGPTPSSFESPILDEYGGVELPLARGRNVIALLCHNPHVALPRRPRLPGALWLDLEATYRNGSRVTLATDRRWRMAAAEDMSRRSPRIHWTAGFTEVRDTRREPAGWTEAGFDDRPWGRADEVRPRVSLEGEPAPVPKPASSPLGRSGRPEETPVLPKRVQSVGRASWRLGVTAIPFEFTVLEPAIGEFYAATFVYSSTKRRARLEFDCDESAAVYVNNRHAARQGYDEEFADWLSESDRDEYAGIHRGQGRRVSWAEVDLEAGWNSVGVVLYDPGMAWGFAMRFCGARTGRPLKLAFSPDQRREDLADWSIVTEELCPCGYGALPETPQPNERTFPDPSYQAAWENRAPSRKAARGTASLLAEPKGKGPLVLEGGSYVRYDFGAETVGHVELEVRGPAGAMLDLLWAETLAADGCLDAVRGGERHADRLILRGEWQTVHMAGRRALRYLELVARTDAGRVEVRRLAVRELHAPDGGAPHLDTGERRLASAFALARRTARCCVQRTFEDIPARDAAQSIPAAWMLAKVERTLFGRAARSADALRAFAADQDGKGFFRAAVPSGARYTIPDWNLLWIIHLAEHLAWTGDRAIAEQLYPAAERVLDWTAAYTDLEGLLENHPDQRPWWLFVDLSPVARTGVVTAWQALYARALRAAAEVADFLGRHEDAGHHEAEATELAKAARRRLWVAGLGVFADARHFEHVSESATPQSNYYALYGGLAGPKSTAKILDTFWSGNEETADWGPMENPFVKYFALAALLEAGEVDRALAIVRSYWGAMARAGYTTVPEVFRSPAATPEGGPGGDGQMPDAPEGGPFGRHPAPVACHAWGCYPEALLAEFVLGVRPGKPGFEPALLVPMPGSLKKARGGVWTPKGLVRASIRTVRGTRKVRYDVPEGLQYRVDARHLAEGDGIEVAGGAEEKG